MLQQWLSKRRWVGVYPSYCWTKDWISQTFWPGVSSSCTDRLSNITLPCFFLETKSLPPALKNKLTFFRVCWGNETPSWVSVALACWFSASGLEAVAKKTRTMMHSSVLFTEPAWLLQTASDKSNELSGWSNQSSSMTSLTLTWPTSVYTSPVMTKAAGENHHVDA